MTCKDVTIVRAHGDQRRLGDLENMGDLWQTGVCAATGHVEGLDTELVHCIIGCPCQ